MVQGKKQGLFWVLAWLNAFLLFDAHAEMRLDRCRHQFWKVAEGLPDNEVQALLQSRQGYLWIGTRSGLARFDGERFTTFDHLNTPELENDDIVALAEDSKGDLWISTRHSIVRKSGSSFQRWPLRELHEEISVGSLCAASNGSVWFTSSHGLMWIQGDQMQTFDVLPFGLSQARALYEHPSGTLWVGGLGGAFSYDLTAGRGQASFVHPDPAGWVNQFELDSQGHLWMSASAGDDANSGVLYELTGTNWVRRQTVAAQNGGRPVFVTARSDGSLWQPHARHGITQWKGQATEHAFPFPDFPLCALEDREHNLWIGTESSGLHCFYGSTIDVLTTADGLIDDNAWTILQAKDGSVWIGTENGLSRLTKTGFENFTQQEGLSRNVIRALAEDQAGRIWIGTGAGLNCYAQGRLQSYQLPGDWVNTKIRTLLAARGNLLWVGTARGLYAVDLNSSELSGPAKVQILEPIKSLYSTNGLADDIRTLLEDRSGALWIGSYDRGLHRLHHGNIEHFGPRQGLDTDRVWALHQSEDGVLWVGTESGLYNYQDGRLVAFTRAQGLWDNVINEVLEDDEGWLWLSGDNGIHAVRRADLAAVARGERTKVVSDVFVESDGLLSRETNGQKSQPAGWKSQDGRLWFPTTRGVAVIDPQVARHDRVPPSAVIEQVRANGQVVFGDADLGVDQVLADPPPGEILRLRADQRDVVEIRYTGNHFAAPDQLRFRYRLEGLDQNWIEAGNRRFAYYAHLPPGNYQFRVMAGTHHNAWDPHGADFSFVVAPRLHQTWGFRSAAVGVFLLVLFGLYRWRLLEEREKQKLKEQAVLAQERSRIAKNLHDEFGASLTAIRMLAELVQRELEQGQGSSHLQKMSQAVINTGQTLRQIIWTNDPSDDTWRGLIDRIHQYGEEFLGSAEIQCLLEESGPPPVGGVSPGLRLDVFRATKEAFHNVVKHAQARTVKIRIQFQSREVLLLVEDDGIGFDASIPRPNGYGMTNMASRLTQVGGRLEINSVLGRGTTITMHIPLGSRRKKRARWRRLLS